MPGRVIQLVNNRGTSIRLPWATPLNLERALEAIGARMDSQRRRAGRVSHSHGASDFKLQASNRRWRGHDQRGELRQALDNAGIPQPRHRDLRLFFGWLGRPDRGRLHTRHDASDARTRHMAAGRFGDHLLRPRPLRRAVAPYALLRTGIRRGRTHHQEARGEAGKPDGFSNPQIIAGGKIRPVLREIEQRLDAARENESSLSSPT